MGHASPETTMVYVQVTAQRLRRAVGLLEGPADSETYVTGVKGVGTPP
jgi:hypothetical protein